jgi:hypothetical protein
VLAVEQLDVGTYGEIEVRGLFQAPTKIAAQPDKDFGERVR